MASCNLHSTVECNFDGISPHSRPARVHIVSRNAACRFPWGSRQCRIKRLFVNRLCSVGNETTHDHTIYNFLRNAMKYFVARRWKFEKLGIASIPFLHDLNNI